MPRIKDVRTWSTNLGNTRPYTIAFKTVDDVHNAFVQLILDNGVAGIGAGNPSEYVTGESIEKTLLALNADNLDFLIGRDIREANQLLAECEEKLASTPAALAAIDIAIHDALTTHLGIPLVKFLGQKIQSLPTSITIGIKNVDDTLKEAQEYRQRGFSVLKVKLGRDLEEDIERIVKLREKFGSQFLIRVDANQGYTLDQTKSFYDRVVNHKTLAPLELIEQPVPAKASGEIRKLPSIIRAMIAVDESLLSPKDALQLVQPDPVAGIFNIKLMKCGGIKRARLIADIASLSGVHLFWGCNDESVVSITAALHVAFSEAGTRYIDLDGSLDLANDVVSGGFILRDGVMRCSDQPGLGVSLNA